MSRNCDHCGREYVAQRKQSRYCSGPCRVKANRKANRGTPEQPKRAERPAPVPVAPLAQEPKPTGGVRAATLAELERAGRVDTPAGQSALALADLMDNPPPMTWSSVAGWAREHRASLAEALKGADEPKSKSTPDMLKERRAAKRLGA